MPRRHGGSLSNDFGRTFVLAATLLAAPDLAQAGCWDNCCSNWDDFKRACSCDGGDAYPNPPRCVPRDGYTPPPPVPVDPRILQNQRYQKIVEAGGAAGVIDANMFTGLPTRTDDDFAATLDKLNLYLRRSIQLSEPRRAYYQAKSNASQSARDTFYKPWFARMDPSGVRPDIRAATEQSHEELARIWRELARVKDLTERFARSGAVAAAKKLHLEEGRGAKMSLWAHLGGLSRGEVESFTETIAPTVTREACCEEKSRPLHELELNSPPSLEYDPEVLRTGQAVSDSVRIVFPAPMTGDFDSRLNLLDNLQVRAAASRAAEAAAVAHFTTKWADQSDRKAWREMLSTNQNFLNDTHLTWQLKIPQAKAELKEALAYFDGETRAFYIEGGRAIGWHLFKKKMLFPELQRIGISVFHGRPFQLTDAEVKHAWKLDKHAVFGAYKDWKGATKSYNLYETAARIEGSFAQGALAMTDLTGRSEVGDYQGLAADMTKDVDTGVREELKKSLQRIDVPAAWRKIWVDGIQF